ncbi:hypothetical protein BDQ12DRAFT_269721 [Crucibulum laeve]|uniref:Uncharacterized protein n=1 Tax=Crucibulum laeve TaxID=68775 RepID=A0A5C3MMD3_9AGAR|nr:hypothetical protein BDQ12DRAFT_269721 [Crucibulum laeve]
MIDIVSSLAVALCSGLSIQYRALTAVEIFNRRSACRHRHVVKHSWFLYLSNCHLLILSSNPRLILSSNLDDLCITSASEALPPYCLPTPCTDLLVLARSCH